MTMTNTTKTLSELLLVDTTQMSADEKEKHLEAMHNITTKAAANDIQLLKPLNDALDKSSEEIYIITEKLSNIAVNDDNYSQALNVVASGVKIAENIIPLPF